MCCFRVEFLLRYIMKLLTMLAGPQQEPVGRPFPSPFGCYPCTQGTCACLRLCPRLCLSVSVPVAVSILVPRSRSLFHL